MKIVDKNTIHEIRELGLLQRKECKYKESIKTFNDLLEIAPKDQRAHIDIAICYRMINLIDESSEILENFLKIDNISENWRETALKNLQINEISKIKSLISKGENTLAIKLLECFIEKNIGRDFHDEIIPLYLELMKHTAFAKLIAYQILFYIEKSNTATIQNTIKSLVIFLIDRGEYNLTQYIIDKYMDDVSFKSLCYLRILTEKNHIQKALIEAQKILNNHKVPRQILKTALQIRYQLGLISFQLDIAKDSLERIDDIDLEQGLAKNSSIMQNIRKNYLHICEQTKVDILGETCQVSLSKNFIDSIKHEKNHYKQIINSAIYLQKILPINGRSLDIKNSKQQKIKVSHSNINIIQYWDKTIPPEDVLVCINSWEKKEVLNHKLYNYESAYDFLFENYDLKIAKLFQNCNHPAIQADIFRLFYIYQKGGIYVDADEYCHELPYFIIDKEPALRFKRVNMLEVTNDFLSLPPNSNIIKIAIESLLNNEEEISTKNVWWISGPGLLIKSLAITYSHELLGLDGGLNHSLRLIHNSDYNMTINTAKLNYKDDERSWQKAAFSSPTLLI